MGVNLSDLVPESAVTPSLFAKPNLRQALGLAVDKINNRFGKNSVHIAAEHAARNLAEEKIAFTKVKMFTEGAPDEDEVMKRRAAEWRKLMLRKKRVG